MPKVSIIIPVFNVQVYLARCINSLLQQTLADIEIILIDDGSTDQSRDIIQTYAQQDVRIKYYTQLNQGPSIARNVGIKLAAGQYIGFVDSDDWIEATMYHHMYEIAEEHKLNMVMCNHIHDYDEKPSLVENLDVPENAVLQREEITRFLLPKLFKDDSYSSLCNKLFKREFIKSIQAEMITGVNYGEDLLFLLTVFDNLDKTYFINTPYYHYVHNNNSLTNRRHNDFNQILCLMYNIRKQYADKWKIPLIHAAESFLYYMLMDMVENLYGQKFRDKKQYLSSIYTNSREVNEALKIVKISKFPYTCKLNILLLLVKWRCINIISLII